MERLALLESVLGGVVDMRGGVVSGVETVGMLEMGG